MSYGRNKYEDVKTSFFLICIQKVFDKSVSLSYTIDTTKVIGGEQYV